MRLQRLYLKNFKGFADFEIALHPEFNLLIGENGSGKTSVLEAMSVAAGSWFLGLRGYDTRHIRPDDVRLEGFSTEGGVNWERQFPCVVGADGVVSDREVSWQRALNSDRGRTTYGEAREVKELAIAADAAVRQGQEITLPLIAYFPTGRLWNVPRDQAVVAGIEKIKTGASLSRLEGYRHGIDSRQSVSDLVEWIARESWRTFQKGGESAVFSRVRRALIDGILGAENIYFDAEYGEIIVELEKGVRQPFNNLSDGQRCMLALIGDLARKCATLNPHLGGEALEKTPGVVLIDELELHLHPAWQRRVVHDLKTTFPTIQFIATTHSPQIISEVKRDQVKVLTPEGATSPGHTFGIDSNRVLEEIMSASERPRSVEAKIEEISRLAQPGTLHDADRALSELEDMLELGENDPEVVRIRTILDFLGE